MKMKWLGLFLIVSILFPLAPVWAHRRYRPLGPPPQDQSISSVSQNNQGNQGNAAGANGVKTRDLLELENAIQEYLLAFEAYLEAKRSSDPQIRSKLPGFLRSYRESYAEFLKKAREDNLVEPKKSKNPGKLYRDAYNSKNTNPVALRKLNTSGQKSVIKDMIRNGATPKEIKDYIKSSLPSTRPGQTAITTTAGTGGSATGGTSTSTPSGTSADLGTNSQGSVSTANAAVAANTPADPYASSGNDPDDTYVGVPWN